MYSFVIVLKGRIDWFDALALFLIFGAYLRRLGKLPKDDDDEEEEAEVGPAAVLTQLPPRKQYAAIAALAIFAASTLVAEAEPFAESLIGAAAALGINKFYRLGEIRDRGFEQQRYRASGLNLVTAAIVLWNTVYLERAVAALHGHGQAVDEDLLRYLSPLGWEHINLTGDYLWRSSAKIGGGRLRPLRPMAGA